jgi:hypothetical protein
MRAPMMPKQPIRVYADTSVFGGVFDEEFAADSREFFDEVTGGEFLLVVSPVIETELEQAPKYVRRFFDECAARAESVTVSDAARQLRDAYVSAGIVTEKYLADALHVALATVAACRVIVSWNFKYIVHFDKIPLHNQVNALMGFQAIAIHSPQEVIAYEAGTDEKDL